MAIASPNTESWPKNSGSTSLGTTIMVKMDFDLLNTLVDLWCTSNSAARDSSKVVGPYEISRIKGIIKVPGLAVVGWVCSRPLARRLPRRENQVALLKVWTRSTNHPMNSRKSA